MNPSIQVHSALPTFTYQKWRILTVAGPALLLLNLVTSSIRNCLWPSSRLHGLKLFLNLLPQLGDEDKVDRIVPYVVELLSDDVAIVRAEACRTLILTVESVQTISAQNATYIPEYLLPQMRHLATDPDVFVRATYATGLVRLADVAVSMLELSQAAKVDKAEVDASGVVEVSDAGMKPTVRDATQLSLTTMRCWRRSRL
jgi:phosphoinositide-3-kinase regulatory subunit 4